MQQVPSLQQVPAVIFQCIEVIIALTYALKYMQGSEQKFVKTT